MTVAEAAALPNEAAVPAAVPSTGPAAAVSPPSFESVSRLIAARGISFAEFWFTDLGGYPWRIAMAADAVTEKLFSSGLTLDGQPVGGAWDGVMLLQPRFDAVYADPSGPSLTMFCDILDPSSRAPMELEPRHVLERAANLVEERLGAKLVLGAEPEFILLQPDGKPAGERVVWDFLRGLALALGEAGVKVDWFRTGPASGQGRVQMRAGAPLLMADRVMLYRQCASTLSRAQGLKVAFLPRPLAGGGTPGMPIHLALWKDGVNLFHDGRGWALTSPLCRSFAAGLLTHLRSLAAFCAPTSNSYRRLISGVSGPTSPLLSAVDRAAACRIPARCTSPGSRRVKFCCPDSTANPYLAFAAVLMAGLDGIERGLEAPVDGGEPMRVRMPHSLEGALDSLDGDRAYLTRTGVFTDRLVDAWIKDRWTRFVVPIRSRPHPWELAEGEEHGRTRGGDAAIT
ncbi:MAG: glutamine synthetase [Elusimicrobia bacterium]|nr:glutamine synthetase [Elusimicrobiota bacterium]